MDKPNYYAILPADVRYDKNLKPIEKIMYCELTALANKNGYCNATNKYFAELYEVHKDTVSSWINNLKKYGYINIEIIKNDKTNAIIERRIYIVEGIGKGIGKNTDTYRQKDLEGYRQKDLEGIGKKTVENNTSNNITSNNNIKEKINKKENEILDYIGTLQISDNYKNKLIEFYNYRKEIKKPIKTKKGIDGILREPFVDEEHAIQCLDFAMYKEYQGVRAEYVKTYDTSGYQGVFVDKDKKREIKEIPKETKKFRYFQ